MFWNGVSGPLPRVIKFHLVHVCGELLYMIKTLLFSVQSNSLRMSRSNDNIIALWSDLSNRLSHLHSYTHTLTVQCTIHLNWTHTCISELQSHYLLKLKVLIDFPVTVTLLRHYCFHSQNYNVYRSVRICRNFICYQSHSENFSGPLTLNIAVDLSLQ